MDILKKQRTHERGFSLMELIVAGFVFIMLSGMIIGSVIQFIGGYRKILADQIAQGEMRYVAEYLSREIRMAICPLGVDCNTFRLVNISMGYNEADPTHYPTLEFLNYKGQLVRYMLVRDAGKNVVGRVCSDAGQECDLGGVPFVHLMNSDKVNITGLTFIINGDKTKTESSIADQRQPAVTVLITGEVEYRGTMKKIFLQTTVAPRKLQS